MRSTKTIGEKVTRGVLLLRSAAIGSLAVVCLLVSAPTGAVPYKAWKVDLPRCDRLYGKVIEEFGNAPAFPQNERVTSQSQTTQDVRCNDPNIESNNPLIDDYLVEIQNLTGGNIGGFGAKGRWHHLAFVADADFTYRNYDGLVSGGFAMEIDAVGMNKPLVYESMIYDNIFQDGEVWRFIVEDWRLKPGAARAFAAPHFFTSCFPDNIDPCTYGKVGIDSVGDLRGSTASLVENIPEPATLALIGFGLAGLAGSRFRKQ